MLNFLTQTYFGGVIMIFIGLLAIWFVKKNPQMAKSDYRGDLKGRIAGIGFIFVGLVVIIAKLFGIK